MLAHTDDAAAALTRSWVMHTRVESWRAGALLAADVPVAGGSHETDRTLQVPDRVTLTVPRLDRGTSWDPTDDPAHPLAPWGQRLRVSIGIELAHGQVEWISRGWYLIQEIDASGDAVTVTAATLLQLIAEAHLTAPFQPTGTFSAAIRSLVEPALTVDLTAAPTDRAVPAGLAWDEDRLGAVFELLAAWPAEAVVDATGTLVVTAPAVDRASALDLASTTAGTMITVGGGGTRDGATNAVVARGTTTDGTTVQGVALDTSGGPLDVSGPFNPLVVPFFFDSPLLTTVDECNTAATTMLTRRQRTAARRRSITAVAWPPLEAGDTVTTDAGPGVVEQLSMPLTPADGPMTMEVRLRA